MSGLSITPTFSTKSIKVAGTSAVGELVPLTINGLSSATGLRVRVRFDNVDCARFPDVEEDAWTFNAGVATGLINFNTVQMRKAFVDMGDRERVPFGIFIEQNSDQILSASGTISVLNWPANSGEDAPYSLNDWPDVVGELDARLISLVLDLEDHKADAAAHAELFALKANASDLGAHIDNTSNPHGVTPAQIGGVTESAFIGHTEGPTAHATLFSGKASASAFGSHIEGQTKSHAVLDNALDGIIDDFNNHDHSGGGLGTTLKHSDLTGIGTKTHAEIDSGLGGLEASVAALDGAVAGVVSSHGVRMAAIAKACEDAALMPVTSDRLRNAQMAFLLGAIRDGASL